MRNQLSLAITDAIMMVLAVGFWTITGRTPKCSQERGWGHPFLSA